MVLIMACSLLGLPFYAANAVLSVSHIESLKFYSEIAAPGEKATYLGLKEQRMTSLLAHFFIGVSLFFAPIVKLVPMPVLTGIFLYFGTISLLGQQFVQRLGLLFMPVKNQPDFSWLRSVRMHRVHLFTSIQAISVIALFIIRYASAIAMAFPLMLVVMVVTRIFVLEKMFTQNELLSLDDEIPSIKKLLKPAKPRQLDLRKMSRLRKSKNTSKNGAEKIPSLNDAKRVRSNGD
jgi:hypothetical protein